MNCTLGRDTLSAYWDGELSAREQDFVRLHLAGCSDCLRELETVKKGTGRLRTLAKCKAPPRIAETVRRELRRMRNAWMTPAAVAAALVLAALAIVARSSPTTPAPRALALPSAVSTPVILIAADDLGTVREEVDLLLQSFHAPVCLGAPDLGTMPELKDTCVTTYLTDAERDAIERHVDRLTGRESKTWSAASLSRERKRVILQFEEVTATK